jgi:hypothetical protein
LAGLNRYHSTKRCLNIIHVELTLPMPLIANQLTSIPITSTPRLNKDQTFFSYQSARTIPWLRLQWLSVNEILKGHKVASDFKPDFNSKAIYAGASDEYINWCWRNMHPRRSIPFRQYLRNIFLRILPQNIPSNNLKQRVKGYGYCC